jgi:hypothetical protein
MKNEILKHLESIKAELLKIDQKSTEGGVSYHTLEVVEAAGGVITINGNAEGLVYLAWCCCELATNQVEGKHFYFDIHGMLTRADKNFVLGFVNRPIPPS